MKFSRIFFIAVLCLSALMLWHSYQPSARYSTIIGGDASRVKFNCIHNSQKQIEAPGDVLIFGSSRTGSYFDDRLISRWVSELSGEATSVQNLNVAGGDVSLSYVFLKEYLEKNTPEVVYVEVFRVKPQVSLIPYVNRAFSSTADWETTTGLLRDFDDTRGLSVRIADTFRVIIDKTDKYLSKLLVRKYSVTVKNTNACIRNEMIKPENFAGVEKARRKFQRLYRTEIEDLKKDRKNAATIRKETNIPRRERALKAYRNDLGKDWESQTPPDWRYDEEMAKRQLYYYDKISELTADKGVQLVYVRPYGLFEPELTADMLEGYEKMFRADIIYPPYNAAKLAYPYYVDPNHAGQQSKRLFALWITEDILIRTGKF